MSYIRIVSKRAGGTRAQKGEVVIPVDRTNRVLGNTFVLNDHRDDKERESVIRKYARKLEADILSNGPMRHELERIGRIVESGQPVAFECWCAPKPCHGNPIRKAIEGLLGMDLTPPDEVPIESAALVEEDNWKQASLF